jgi:hypothetical protein
MFATPGFWRIFCGTAVFCRIFCGTDVTEASIMGLFILFLIFLYQAPGFAGLPEDPLPLGGTQAPPLSGQEEAEGEFVRLVTAFYEDMRLEGEVNQEQTIPGLLEFFERRNKVIIGFFNQVESLKGFLGEKSLREVEEWARRDMSLTVFESYISLALHYIHSARVLCQGKGEEFFQTHPCAKVRALFIFCKTFVLSFEEVHSGNAQLILRKVENLYLNSQFLFLVALATLQNLLAS